MESAPSWVGGDGSPKEELGQRAPRIPQRQVQAPPLTPPTAGAHFPAVGHRGGGTGEEQGEAEHSACRAELG